MLLTPTEMERLTIYVAAEMARKRRAKGLKLNHPEATAYIADEILFREGRDLGLGEDDAVIKRRIRQKYQVMSEELLATGADTLAVACPFCLTMISDGARALGSEAPVQDIAEIVASRLPAKV